MKKILLGFAAIALCSVTASAQNSANSKFAKNYRVCMVGNEYQVCGENAPKISETSDASNSQRFGMTTTEVHMGYGQNARYRSRIKVTYDDMNNPYEGKPSMSNDGVKQNISRNLNYLDAGVSLPPNDGGISNR